MNVEHGFKTRTQTARELGGGDWEANIEQIKRENELFKDATVGSPQTGQSTIAPNNNTGNNQNGGSNNA
jgi:hypothetical protein